MLQYQSDHQLIYRRISCVDRHLKKCCLKYALSLWKMKFRISWKLTIKRVYKDGPITDRFTVDIPRVARRCFKSSLKRYPVQLWESYTFSVNQWRLLSIKDCVLYEWKIAGFFYFERSRQSFVGNVFNFRVRQCNLEFGSQIFENLIFQWYKCDQCQISLMVSSIVREKLDCINNFL